MAELYATYQIYCVILNKVPNNTYLEKIVVKVKGAQIANRIPKKYH